MLLSCFQACALTLAGETPVCSKGHGKGTASSCYVKSTAFGTFSLCGRGCNDLTSNPKCAHSGVHVGWLGAGACQYGIGIAVGTPLVYSIDKSLPSGIHFDIGTGQIYGTPTEQSGSEVYTVTAENSAGSDSVAVTIRVILPCGFLKMPGAFKYSKSSYVIIRNTAFSASSDVELYGCSIQPDLPAGLSLDAMSCKITGTPLVSIHETTHKVSGIHECGHFSTSVRIAVLDIPPVYTLSGGAHQSTVIDELLEEMAHVSGDPAKYSVAPTLPHGLYLNDGGDLTGVPLKVQAPRTYTFTASNTGGVAKFTQAIEVLAQKPTGFGYDGILGPNTITWKWTAGHQYREIPHLETGNAGDATVTYAILKTSTSNSTVNYMGCFNDDINGQRDLPVYKGSHMSYSACKEACSGYAYFGRQYFSQCRCGNSFGSMGKVHLSLFLTHVLLSHAYVGRRILLNIIAVVITSCKQHPQRPQGPLIS